MSRLDAQALLRRALTAAAARAGTPIVIERSDSTRWASATFTGARHEIALTAAEAPGLDCWLGDLPEAELPLPGHLVADLKLVTVERDAAGARVVLEALTVEDR